MVEGPAPGRESVIAIDEQDRENVVADGLKTSHADKGNRRGNKSVFLGAFPNEINSLGRRFVSHQPPHRNFMIQRPFGAVVVSAPASTTMWNAGAPVHARPRCAATVAGHNPPLGAGPLVNTAGQPSRTGRRPST